MVFANLTFLYLFLPINLILYYLSKNITYRNLVLVVFSLFFYAWGEPVWIILLIFSATIDYFHGLLVQAFKGTPIAKLAVASSLILNLGLLCLFKYSGFLYENISQLTGIDLAIPQFTLPIGISFYTFQTISYVLDVYRGKVRAQKSFMDFLLFVTMFHQLVAGPIVRYAHISHEIRHRKTTTDDIYRGISRFCAGLGKKVILANSAGEYATLYLSGDLNALSTPAAWFGLLMFSLQIYFDFSGYSDMAIGLGNLFGFHYMENFNHPYVSGSVTEFWRRWHMSLGTFFRDYVYIPLGGNRKHQYFNLLVVWFLTGLWHGASWNFIIWGLYFGLFIAIERLFLGKLLQKIRFVLPNLYLLFVVMIGWAIFYYTNTNQLLQFLGILFGGGVPHIDPSLKINLFNNIFWLAAALVLCTPIVRILSMFFDYMAKPIDSLVAGIIRSGIRPQARGLGKLWSNIVSLIPQPQGGIIVRFVHLTISVMLLILCTALLVGQSYNPFLYFRF